MTRFLVLALAIVALAAASQPGAASAQAEVTETSVDNGYPGELTFNLSASADTEITDVTLRYSIVGASASGIGKPEDFQAGTSIDAGVVVEVNSGNNFIPVSSEFQYSWDIQTADGEVTTTEEETFLYLPPDRDWRTVEDQVLRVYFYGDREGTANDYLAAAQETYQRIAIDLLQTELTVTPVNIVLFATEEEMDTARVGRGGSFDAAVTTCGTKFNINTVFVIPVSCGTSDITDTLRHEFAHIVNEAAGEGAFGQLPSWLDEGTAVVAQSEPGDGFQGAFEAAVRNDSLIPFNQMGSPSNDPGAVNLFYGQSWAMASFLIDREGPAEYARFFDTIQEGSRFDQALQEIYGFDLAGFEDVFRQEYGLEPQSQPEADPTDAPEQQQPQEPAESPAADATRPPLNTSTGGDDGGFDRNIVFIVGAAAVFGLLGVMFYLLSAMLASNRGSAGTGGSPPSAGPPDGPQPPPPPPSNSRSRLLWREDEPPRDDNPGQDPGDR